MHFRLSRAAWTVGAGAPACLSERLCCCTSVVWEDHHPHSGESTKTSLTEQTRQRLSGTQGETCSVRWLILGGKARAVSGVAEG